MNGYSPLSPQGQVDMSFCLPQALSRDETSKAIKPGFSLVMNLTLTGLQVVAKYSYNFFIHAFYIKMLFYVS